jgi:hypothetical protein
MAYLLAGGKLWHLRLFILCDQVMLSVVKPRSAYGSNHDMPDAHVQICVTKPMRYLRLSISK